LSAIAYSILSKRNNKAAKPAASLGRNKFLSQRGVFDDTY